VADTLVASAYLRVEDGRLLTLDVQQWIDAADPVDERLLDRARGPVLDVGCGPGRHVEALGRRGIDALGLDISPRAVAFARRRGAQVLQRSIFDALDEGSPWCTALLLDGSVGIGGEPIALLRRIGQLLTGDGRVLVEAEPAHVASESLVVRMETRRRVGPWFRWARVSVADVADVAAAAGFLAMETWEDGGRLFTSLERRSRL